MSLAEWILGDDAEGNHYLIHTQAPRFIGRLATDDDATASGITFALRGSGETLCDIQWIDPAHTMEQTFEDLLNAIEEALDTHDEQAINDLEEALPNRPNH